MTKGLREKGLYTEIQVCTKSRNRRTLFKNIQHKGSYKSSFTKD